MIGIAKITIPIKIAAPREIPFSPTDTILDLERSYFRLWELYVFSSRTVLHDSKYHDF